EHACTPGDGAGPEPGRFQEYVDRVAGNRTRRAAHDAGQCHRPAVVRDDQGAGRNLHVGAVEQVQFLAIAGMADNDAAAQTVEVEGVHRLPELEHHVVGDVHRQADGPKTRSPQPLADEVGRFGVDVDALDHPPGITRAV